MQDLINKLRTGERVLLDGCTYEQLAEAIGESTKSARRMVTLFRELGAVIKESPVTAKGKLCLRVKRSTRIFR